MKQIYCYKNGTPLTLLAVVDDYESFSFQRSYSGIGTWQLVINSLTVNAERIAEVEFISAGNGVAGLVKQVKKNNAENNTTITLTGIELKGIADFRIVMPPTSQAYLSLSGSPEYVIAELLRTQLIEAGESRALPNVSIAAYTSGAETISKDYRFQSVSEAIVELANAYYVGWYADIENGGIVFHIYSGVDRTAAQSTNDRLIVSYDRNNLNSSNYTKNYYIPQTALVAGQGEGVDRQLDLVGDGQTGFNRNEIYVDARDIEDATLLAARGQEKLVEFSSDDVYDMAFGQHMIDTYCIDFDLGDIGTVYDEDLPGGKKDFYLTEVEEVYEADDVQIHATFGYDKTTLNSAIKRINANSNALVYSEQKQTEIDIDAIIAAAKLAQRPVGSYYWSSDPTSPAILFGGTWAQVKDRFILAAGDTYSAGDTGGEQTVTLSINEMPIHNHTTNARSGQGQLGQWQNIAFPNNTGTQTTISTDSAGGNQPHNNMPPYEVAYCWKRTA